MPLQGLLVSDRACCSLCEGDVLFCFSLEFKDDIAEKDVLPYASQPHMNRHFAVDPDG